MSNLFLGAVNFINNNPYINKTGNVKARAISFKGLQKDEFTKTAAPVKAEGTKTPVDSSLKLSEGLDFYKKGDYKGCIEALTASIENTDKPSGRAFHCRGSAYRTLGNYDSALEDYTKAIELCPNSTNTMQLRGRTSYLKATKAHLSETERNSLLTSALADFDAVLEKKPEDTDTLKYKASTYMALGDYVTAADTLEEGIICGEVFLEMADKNNASNGQISHVKALIGDMHHVRGTALLNQAADNDPVLLKEAIEEYSKALEYCPKSTNTMKALGRTNYILAQKGGLKGEEFKKAIADSISSYDNYLELKQTPEVYKFKADSYNLAGEWEKAAEALKEGIICGEASLAETGKNNKQTSQTRSLVADMHHVRGTALQKQAANGDPVLLKEAIEEYSKALEYCPKSTNTMKALGRTNYILAQKGGLKGEEFKKAIADSISSYDNYLELKQTPEVYKFKADSYNLAGEWEKAADTLECAIEYERSQLDEAEKAGDEEKEASLKSSIAKSLHSKANCLRRAGKYEDACVEYEKAINYNPNASNSMKLYGRTLYLQALQKEIFDSSRDVDLSMSVIQYDKALELNKNLETYLYKTESLMQLRKYDQAIDTLGEARDLLNDELTEIAASEGENSLNYLNKRASLAEIYKKRGVCHIKSKHSSHHKFPAAVEEFTKAIEVSPKESANYYYWRACANSHVETKDAKADIKKAIDLNPNCAEYWRTLSSILRFSDDPEEKQEYLDATLKHIMLKNKG